MCLFSASKNCAACSLLWSLDTMEHSHAKAQFLYLSCAAAGQSCAGLRTGRRRSWGRSRWLHAQLHLPGLCAGDGWTPRPPSRTSSLPFMSCSHWSPHGQKLTAAFASCFQPSCFICSPASGPRLTLKPPEARRTGKGLQHLDLFPALLWAASGCRQYWEKTAPMERGLGWYVLWEKLRSWEEMLAIVVSRVSADTSLCFYLKQNHLLL